jgi:hypothetical protein
MIGFKISMSRKLFSVTVLPFMILLNSSRCHPYDALGSSNMKYEIESVFFERE